MCVRARARHGKQEDDGISGAYKFDVSWRRDVKEDATWPAIAVEIRTKMERGKFARQLVQSISVVGGRGLAAVVNARQMQPLVLSREKRKRKGKGWEKNEEMKWIF